MASDLKSHSQGKPSNTLFFMHNLFLAGQLPKNREAKVFFRYLGISGMRAKALVFLAAGLMLAPSDGAAQGVVVPVLHLGLPDQFIDHGEQGQLLRSVGLDAEGIERSIRARFGDAVGAPTPAEGAVAPAPRLVSSRP